MKLKQIISNGIFGTMLYAAVAMPGCALNKDFNEHPEKINAAPIDAKYETFQDRKKETFQTNESTYRCSGGNMCVYETYKDGSTNLIVIENYNDLGQLVKKHTMMPSERINIKCNYTYSEDGTQTEFCN